MVGSGASTGDTTQPGAVAGELHVRSRIDMWVPVVLVGPIAIALWGIASRFAEEPAAGLIPAGVILLAALALVLWILFGTSYTLTATDLVIRCGPGRVSIPCQTIRRVRRTRTLLAAPALSLRRIELTYGRFGTAVISPPDIDAFTEALKARNPSIEGP